MPVTVPNATCERGVTGVAMGSANGGGMVVRAEGVTGGIGIGVKGVNDCLRMALGRDGS